MIDYFEKRLGISEFPDTFDKIYSNACAEYEKSGVFFLEDGYIRALNEKTSALLRTENEVIRAATAARSNEAAAKYALFVYLAMKDRELFMAHLSLFSFPEDHPFLAFLCLLPSVDALFDGLMQKGFDREIVLATVRQYEDCLFLGLERTGIFGLGKRYFDHLQCYVDQKIFNIKRLRFEKKTLKDVFLLRNHSTKEYMLFLDGKKINSAGLIEGTPPIADGESFDAFFSETETEYIGTAVNSRGRCKKDPIALKKSEWELKLRPGDICLAVHIPAGGALTEEAVRESYDCAYSVFREHFPELAVKGFYCHSWMLAPELESILKPESNLLSFQKPYIKYPCPTRGEDVMTFVFGQKPKNYADLPEGTSLQRALKKIYLSGDYLYEYCGIIPI